jgi:hypothetical protein
MAAGDTFLTSTPTLGGDYAIQRGRPNPNSRLFGPVTIRTRRRQPYDPTTTPVLTQRGAPQGGAYDHEGDGAGGLLVIVGEQEGMGPLISTASRLEVIRGGQAQHHEAWATGE